MKKSSEVLLVAALLLAAFAVPTLESDAPVEKNPAVTATAAVSVASRP